MKNQILVLLLCGCLSVAMASPFSPPTPDPYFQAISPIFGYDPAYGTLLGVAWFSYPTGDVADEQTRTDLNLVMRFGPHGAFSIQQQRPKLTNVFGLNAGFGVNNFYEYETAINSTEILSTSDQLSVNGYLTLRKPFAENFEMQLGAHAKTKHQAHQFSTAGYVKTAIVLDMRDNPVNSHEGLFTDLNLKVQPAWAINQSDSGSTQLTLDARWFVPVSNQHTLALRSLLQTAKGDGLVSQVGGSELLRGYLGGQFEGQHLVAAQSEFRFPVWNFIKGVAFAESARVFQVSDTLQLQSAGLGLRFGLPPDHSMSVRLDIAVNDYGQWQSFVNFNQVF